MPNDTAVLRFALDTVRRAGKIALRGFRGGFKVEYKRDSSPVTRIDRAVEESIRRAITRAFPHDGLVGEEYGTAGKGAEASWIIDPIDGTKNFIRGVPFWGILLAREVRGRLTLGIIHMPAIGETLWAVRGGGAFCNGKRMKVSRVRDLKRAYVLHGGLEYFVKQGHARALERISVKSAIARSFGDCWAYGFVARGQAEAMFENGVKPWDTAACKIIVEEAGGRYTDWKGKDTYKSPSVLATNGLLHDRILKLLK